MVCNNSIFVQYIHIQHCVSCSLFGFFYEDKVFHRILAVPVSAIFAFH